MSDFFLRARKPPAREGKCISLSAEGGSINPVPINQRDRLCHSWLAPPARCLSRLPPLLLSLFHFLSYAGESVFPSSLVGPATWILTVIPIMRKANCFDCVKSQLFELVKCLMFGCATCSVVRQGSQPTVDTVPVKWKDIETSGTFANIN